MTGTSVIDHFLEVFTRYIDSGFGLLSGEVSFLASALIALDMTLAGLFWAWSADDDVIARLVRKTLYVGTFAYIIGNWNTLVRIIFDSFSGLGLKATGTGFTAQDLLSPGRIAQVGLDAGRPILSAIADLIGYIEFFENFLQIIILLLAWATVLAAFFILAIQLFVTLIEFKLTTLAGFVLIPFGLFGRTAFLAERVLGNVVSCGVKVLVLAVIIGIGSTLFAEFTRGFGGAQPTIDDAMAIALAALSLLGLGIFGPGIGNGLVSGGPQLGAGAAIGTGHAAGGMIAAAAAGTRIAAATMGRSVAGSVRQTRSGAISAMSGPVAASQGETISADPAISPLRRDGSASPVPASGDRVETGASQAGAGFSTSRTAAGGSTPPAWAQRLRRTQAVHRGVAALTHAIHAGDSPHRGTSITLGEGGGA